MPAVSNHEYATDYTDPTGTKLAGRSSNDNEVWIDTWQDRPDNVDQHYIVKFPRNQRALIDCEILRTEYHYYHELHAMGVSTIDVSRLRLEEGEQYPSLWIPRFDTDYKQGYERRYGLESVYSLLEKDPGSFLNHLEAIEQLATLLPEADPAFNVKEFVIEWVCRDLLNVAFGNSDNHGRNSAVLKTGDSIRLSPVYDFAPMKADPEGVIRSTKWSPPLEEAGGFKWREISLALARYVPPDELFESLRKQAQALQGLYERLRQRGVSSHILEMPAIGLKQLDKKLSHWDLL